MSESRGAGVLAPASAEPSASRGHPMYWLGAAVRSTVRPPESITHGGCTLRSWRTRRIVRSAVDYQATTACAEGRISSRNANRDHQSSPARGLKNQTRAHSTCGACSRATRAVDGVRSRVVLNLARNALVRSSARTSTAAAMP